MAIEDKGLKHRLAGEARRISSQHDQLNEFCARVAEALGDGDAAAVRAGFQRLHDALEAHFSMEDRVHFPALHGLRPELESEIMGLAEEHVGLRADMEDLDALFTAGRLEDAAPLFEDLIAALVAHERAEEKLLASLGVKPRA